MSAPGGLVSRFRVPDLGVGVGYRLPHADEVLHTRPAIDFYEIISENYMADGGPPLARLDRLRALAPVVPHGVSMSLGSTAPPDHSPRLDRLLDRVKPPWFSDHLCFTGAAGINAHDLLPLPYTAERRAHVVDRIREVQDRTGRLLAVENVSSYLSYAASDQSEWDFLAEVAEAADCGLLLDLNNIVVSAYNHGFDPAEYLAAVPLDRVVQIHLAGHTIKAEGYRLDTHDAEVCDEVWALYQETIKRTGSISTLIEWDDHIPPLARLVAEVDSARARREAGLLERARAAR